MIAARRDDVLKSAAEKITAESGGPQVLYKRLDLTERAKIDEVADQAVDELGGVDIFVGNAAYEQFEHVGVLVLLASDAGSYMTGEEIRMDSGLAMMMKPNPRKS